MCLFMSDRKHERSPLGEVTPKPQRCAAHEKKLELVCKTCDSKPICLMCTTHGDHVNHKSVLLKQEMDNLRTELQKKIGDLDELSKRILDAKRVVERSRGEIEEVRESIHFCFLRFVKRVLMDSMKR